jgi:hypothetical protein
MEARLPRLAPAPMPRWLVDLATEALLDQGEDEVQHQSGRKRIKLMRHATRLGQCSGMTPEPRSCS